MGVSTVLAAILAVVHALAGAAWFGAMFYSLAVLQPRAIRYFAKPEEFETFIATLSRGARWTVLAAFGIVGLSGIGLAVVHGEDVSQIWLLLMGLKVAIFVIAFGLFVHVSWRLWPARVLALSNEIPHFQRTSRRLAVIMLCLVGLSMALGVLAHCR